MNAGRVLLGTAWADHRAALAVGVSLALAINLALALPRLAEAPLDFDEAATASVVDGSRGGVLASVRAVETNGPTYFYLVAATTALTGVSPGSLRAVSLVAGLLGLLGVAGVGARWLRPGAGAIAALLAGASAFLVFYELQARFYTMSLAWAVLTTGLFLWLLDRPGWGRGLVYGAAAGIGGSIFTLGFALPLAHGVAALACPPAAGRPWRPLLVAAASVVSIAALELPLLLQQTEIAAVFWIPPKGFIEALPDLYQLGGTGVLSWSLLLAAAAGGWIGLARPRSLRERTVTAVLIAWALAVPLLLVALSLLGRPSILGRYAAPSVPAIWLLAASGLSRLPLAAPAAALGWIVFAMFGWRSLVDTGIDYRIAYLRTYRAVEARVGPGDVLLYTNRFHFLPATRVHPPEIELRVFEVDMHPRLRSVLGPDRVVDGPDELAGFDSVWVVHQRGDGLFGRPGWVPPDSETLRVPPAGLWLTRYRPGDG